MPFGPFCASIWTSGRREQHRLRAVCTFSLGLRHSRCFAFYTPCRVPPARTYFSFTAALDYCPAVSLISFVTSILIRFFHGPVEKTQPSLQRQQPQNITKANKLRSTYLHTSSNRHPLLSPTGLLTFFDTFSTRLAPLHQIENTPALVAIGATEGSFLCSAHGLSFHSSVYLSIRLLFSPGWG